MARDFARLKLALIRNGLRTPQYAVLFSIGACGAGILAFIGFAFLASLRGDPAAPDAVLVVFAAITAAWTIIPLLGFGTDETLDPQRLALLPLDREQLLRGLFAAALVGVAPIATAAALAGAVVALAHDPLSAALIVLSVLMTILLCVALSRTLIAILAPLLRSRRGRDLTVMALTLAVLVPESFRLFATDKHIGDLHHTVSHLADRVRYTPFAIGGLAASEAGRGHVAAALFALVAVVALLAGLLAIWARAIPRAMTASDGVAPEARARASRTRLPLYPRWAPFLPRNRVGATAAKELRYYLRDPRRRAPLITALVVPALFMFSTLRDGQTRPAATTLLALVALLPASGLTLNQFGLDGAALWATIVSGNAVDADFRGKNLATLVIVLPLVVVPAVVIAWTVHGWSYLPITILLAPGLLGVVLAVGNVVSAWAPYAIPDRRNPLASNPGQGCVGGLAALAAIAVDVALVLPIGLPVGYLLDAAPLAIATVVSAALCALYGLLALRIGLRVATRRLSGRMPELLEAVSPRQAA